MIHSISAEGSGKNIVEEVMVVREGCKDFGPRHGIAPSDSIHVVCSTPLSSMKQTGQSLLVWKTVFQDKSCSSFEASSLRRLLLLTCTENVMCGCV